jgi:hypothetical protein
MGCHQAGPRETGCTNMEGQEQQTLGPEAHLRVAGALMWNNWGAESLPFDSMPLRVPVSLQHDPICQDAQTSMVGAKPLPWPCLLGLGFSSPNLLHLHWEVSGTCTGQPPEICEHDTPTHPLRDQVQYNNHPSGLQTPVPPWMQPPGASLPQWRP